MVKKRYSEEEERKLLSVIQSNQVRNVLQIAEELGKTPNSVRSKLRKLGVPDYSEEENKIIRKMFSSNDKSGSAKKIHELLPHRSCRSIMTQALKLGVSSTSFWSDQENQILIQHFNNKKAGQSCIEINKRFLPNRSIGAIKQQAKVLGLSRNFKEIAWKEEELDILHTYAESIPVVKIMSKLKKLWTTKGWAHRSYDAVTVKLRKLEYSLKFEGGYYTVDQLSSALRCSRTHIARLYKKYATVLKPQEIGNYHVVKVDNLKMFIMMYPGEIANLAPDIVWLIGILSPDGMLTTFSNQSGYRS